MEYAKEERIGNPDLFTGRKKEISYFLEWIHNIKQKKSRSTAIMARRKMGKTAILERLFNITFFNNEGIIPFYYELNETEMYIVDFCQEFFLTFIYQYIAFKSRKPEYLDPAARSDIQQAIETAEKEGFNYLCPIIKDVAHAVAHEKIDILWNIVREAPKTIASRQKEYIVQMIDEFQFLNAKICRDKDAKIPAGNLAGGYLSAAESKIAPLLVSGSWVGWLMKELNINLPSRFIYEYLENMPEEEAYEMIYKYSGFFEVPISEEIAFLLTRIAESSPFYISSIIRSRYEHKDLTTIDGLTKTLEFETLDDRGVIKTTWMEYVTSAFKDVNNINAKNIVLYLCKHRDREVTRQEIMDNLQLDMTGNELEKKLKALIEADIIKKGQTSFDYRGVDDNIFDKVFRGEYEKEIRLFDVKEIAKEYRAELAKVKKEYNRLLGKFNYHKGYFAEYLILDRLMLHACADNELLKSITRYLPADFNFSEYTRVWKYYSSPEYKKMFSLDVYARAVNPADYSIIGEVKSRDTKKFSKDEVIGFERKFADLKRLENLERAQGFIFSCNGFTQEAEGYCKEKGIACSDDERWFI